MNKIQIFVFKPTGKYYTSTKWLEVPEGFMYWEDRFEEFVRRNCDINYNSSFGYDLVIIDSDENKDFFMRMYKSKEMV